MTSMRIKYLPVLHGNSDRSIFFVHRDSAFEDLSVTRLVFSLGLILCFSFGTADVEGSYIQSDPIKR